MSILFDINNESGSSEYEGITGADTSVTTDAAIFGNYGLQTIINDTTSTFAWSSGSGSTGVIRARFYLNPNSLEMASDDVFECFGIYNSSAQGAGYLQLHYDGADYDLRLLLVTDTGTFPTSPLTPNISNDSHCIEIMLVRATGESTNDGYMSIWIDGVESTGITGQDNYTRFANFGGFRIGAVADIDSGTTGTIYFDNLIVNDDGSEIGIYVEGQFSYPIADVVVSGWKNELGQSTNLYLSIDEETAIDTDYIQSPNLPAGEIYETTLSGLSTPITWSGHILRYRYTKSGSGEIDLTVKLMEGATIIAQWTHSGITDSWVTAEQTLTQVQAESISNYGDLSVITIANI